MGKIGKLARKALSEELTVSRKLKKAEDKSCEDLW